jgi:hypothetical protein
MRLSVKYVESQVATLNERLPSVDGYYHLYQGACGYAIHWVYPDTSCRNLFSSNKLAEVSAWLQGAIAITYKLKSNNEH